MNKEKIIELLSIGENCEVEFKEAKGQIPKSVLSTYSAFANTRGRSNCFRRCRRKRNKQV